MFVLSRADHLHFVDDVEREHEAFRALTLPGDAAWMRQSEAAGRFLAAEADSALAVRGVDAAADPGC